MRMLITAVCPAVGPLGLIQATIAVRLGGCGMRSCVAHAGAAYQATTEASDATMRSLCNTFVGAALRTKPTPQKKLSLAIEQQTIKALVDESSPESQAVEPKDRRVARLVAIATQGAGSWLAPNVDAADLASLPPAFFRVLCAYRLGVPLFDSAKRPTCPRCRECRVDVFGDHMLVCAAGGSKIGVHNCVRDAVMLMAGVANLHPRHEPSTTGRSRADLAYTIAGVQQFLDFTLTAPLRQPLLKPPKRSVERIFVEKYAHLQATGQSFVIPIAFDMFGGSTEESISALKTICKAFAQSHDNQRAASFRFWAKILHVIAHWSAEALTDACLRIVT